MLNARRHNESHGNPDAELFEVANVYLPRLGQPLPDQPTRLAIVSGRDFLGLKGVIEGLLERFHSIEGFAARPASVPMFATGRAAELTYTNAAATVTAVSVALLGWLILETQSGPALGLAERLSSSLQTSWPLIVALVVRAHTPRTSTAASSRGPAEVRPAR